MYKRTDHFILRKYMTDLIASLWAQTIPKVFDFLEIPSHFYKLDNNKHNVKFSNGSMIYCRGAENDKAVENALGTEFATAWFNEAHQFTPGAIGIILTRLAAKSGMHPRILLDFNPPETSSWTYELIVNNRIEDALVDSASILMNPRDNITNLNPAYLDILKMLPERQRKRFLDGEFVSPDEAIFTADMINDGQIPAFFNRIVIGIDPAISNRKKSDETGIFVMGIAAGVKYKLEDLSLKASPEGWSTRVVSTALKYQKIAKEVVAVAEVNQGGDMVGSVIYNACAAMGVQRIEYKAVRTNVGKEYRAEVFSIRLAKQKYIWAQGLDAYKKQFLGFTALIHNGGSPDRVDAAIIADTQIDATNSSSLYYITN